eukprot:jgi/Chlat1/8442/Chrsp80S07854
MAGDPGADDDGHDYSEDFEAVLSDELHSPTSPPARLHASQNTVKHTPAHSSSGSSKRPEKKLHATPPSIQATLTTTTRAMSTSQASTTTKVSSSRHVKADKDVAADKDKEREKEDPEQRARRRRDEKKELARLRVEVGELRAREAQLQKEHEVKLAKLQAQLREEQHIPPAGSRPQAEWIEACAQFGSKVDDAMDMLKVLAAKHREPLAASHPNNASVSATILLERERHVAAATQQLGALRGAVESAAAALQRRQDEERLVLEEERARLVHLQDVCNMERARLAAAHEACQKERDSILTHAISERRALGTERAAVESAARGVADVEARARTSREDLAATKAQRDEMERRRAQLEADIKAFDEDAASVSQLGIEVRAASEKLRERHSDIKRQQAELQGERQQLAAEQHMFVTRQQQLDDREHKLESMEKLLQSEQLSWAMQRRKWVQERSQALQAAEQARLAQAQLFNCAGINVRQNSHADFNRLTIRNAPKAKPSARALFASVRETIEHLGVTAHDWSREVL